MQNVAKSRLLKVKQGFEAGGGFYMFEGRVYRI